MRTRQVLQTYNFRVNVTSRMYFEVGMHMHSQHVTMQLSSLNERAYTVQGKQRGNLNIIDIQISPGDYSVTLK
jgi:translation initiation factor IF-1